MRCRKNVTGNQMKPPTQVATVRKCFTYLGEIKHDESNNNNSNLCVCVVLWMCECVGELKCTMISTFVWAKWMTRNCYCSGVCDMNRRSVWIISLFYHFELWYYTSNLLHLHNTKYLSVEHMNCDKCHWIPI